MRSSMNTNNVASPDSTIAQLRGATVAELFIGNGNMLRLVARQDADELSLRTWGCAWQLRDSARLLIGSNDELEAGPQIPQIVGKAVKAISAHEVTKTLSVQIEGGFELTLMLTETSGDDYSFQWSLHPASDYHLMVLAGGSWKLERNT